MPENNNALFGLEGNGAAYTAFVSCRCWFPCELQVGLQVFCDARRGVDKCMLCTSLDLITACMLDVLMMIIKGGIYIMQCAVQCILFRTPRSACAIAGVPQCCTHFQEPVTPRCCIESCDNCVRCCWHVYCLRVPAALFLSVVLCFPWLRSSAPQSHARVWGMLCMCVTCGLAGDMPLVCLITQLLPMFSSAQCTNRLG